MVISLHLGWLALYLKSEARRLGIVCIGKVKVQLFAALKLIRVPSKTWRTTGHRTSIIHVEVRCGNFDRKGTQGHIGACVPNDLTDATPILQTNMLLLFFAMVSHQSNFNTVLPH